VPRKTAAQLDRDVAKVLKRPTMTVKRADEVIRAAQEKAIEAGARGQCPPRNIESARSDGIMSYQEDRRALLLARRLPRTEIEIGRAYVIHARNGGVGIAVREGNSLGYQLHREKFDRHYLFVENDWDEGAPFGTAIPLTLIEELPPKDETELLA
jgi:hypothetical protein